MPLIDPSEVEQIFRDCLYRPEELENDKPKEGQPDFVPVEGIHGKFGFHPERLKQHKEAICKMLDGLGDEFREKGGGGWSFLNACNDKNGEQWTGLQIRMSELLALGIAVEKAQILMPKEMWALFPGGVPYFVVKETA